MKTISLLSVALAAAVLLSGCGQAEASIPPGKVVFVQVGDLWRAHDPDTGVNCYKTAGGSLSCVRN